eukprot:7848057-Alexandrium_andersonii.AAC.1
MPPAVEEPIGGLPATARNEGGARRELGADAEVEEFKKAEGHGADPSEPQADGGSRATSSDDSRGSAHAGRGPDLAPRTWRTWADSWSGPESPADWGKFDVG